MGNNLFNRGSRLAFPIIMVEMGPPFPMETFFASLKYGDLSWELTRRRCLHLSFVASILHSQC